MGDDQGVRVPAQSRRPRVGGDDRPRSGDRRDHRGRAAHRQLAAHQREHLRARRHVGRDHRQPVRRGGRDPARRAHRHGCGAARAHRRGRDPGPGHRQPLRPPLRSGGMTAVASHLTPLPKSRARKVKNFVATAVIGLAFVVALVPLVFLVVYVVQQGSKVISWEFLTEDLPFVDRLPGGGMNPAVVGTLLITGAASLMAIPLGVLGGIYLNEYGGRSPLARFIRFLSEVMTGVPSIVMGLFIYTLVVLNTKEKTGFAGAVALACLMLPIVIRTTDQMLALVPSELREGSFALGSRKVRTIRTVVLPSAAAGIVSGALLAVARAAGETAPLLFTIGVVREANTDLFAGQNTALSVQIFTNATSPFSVQQDRAWGAALTLIVIVFVATIAARLVTAFFARRQAA